jgi:hypothetical protein
VLDGVVGSFYEYAELEEQFAALSGDVLMSIPDAAVASAAAEAPAAGRFELILNAQGTELYAAGLKTFYNQPFRFVCNDETLFIGVVYLRAGAAALRTPVLHFEQEEGGPARLLLGANQGAWLFGSLGIEQTDKERIDRPELRSAFCARGILGELDPL